MKRIAFIVSAPGTADVFLKGHILTLSEYYEVDLIANFPDDYQPSLATCNLVHAPIERNINVWHDFMAFIALIRIFYRYRYDAVHSVTPKAGLLAMTAAWLTRVSIRHHTFTGQVWATKTGFFRYFLRFLDAITHRLSTCSLVDSKSQRDFLLSENVVFSERSFVLASGSIAGVDFKRFKPDLEKRAMVRKEHGIRDDEFVFLFIGRINLEKGMPELISAFCSISSKHPSSRLMVVGCDETGFFYDNILAESLGEKLIRVDFTREPEAYFNAADVLCLPSHREGFGSVVIEAAACGVPCVASNIYGISDAVIDGETGLLHAPKSTKDLAEKMNAIICQPELRKALGSNAFERVHNEFSALVVEQALLEFYQESFLNCKLM